MLIAGAIHAVHQCDNCTPPHCTHHRLHAGKTAELSLKDAQTTVNEKKQAGKKKKTVQEVVIARAVRNKKKCVTTVSGLDTFGVKLSEAAKVFGKKFACGASVTKTAAGGEEIDIQVCCVIHCMESRYICVSVVLMFMIVGHHVAHK